MSFIDTDEYIVPAPNQTWPTLLENIENTRPDIHVLKMRSSRGRPREDLMEEIPDQTKCGASDRQRRQPLDPCLQPRRNETFLRVYNCEYIKPPRPDRFARAMKQIYRPSFVMSHFVHYSTITRDIARLYRDWPNGGADFTKRVQEKEWGDVFLDELHEGMLIHTKSVLPYETMSRTTHCVNGKKGCGVGRVCPESTPYDDGVHQQNPFKDENGDYCNCWINQNAEQYWIPQLEEALRNFVN